MADHAYPSIRASRYSGNRVPPIILSRQPPALPYRRTTRKFSQPGQYQGFIISNGDLV